MSKVLIVEDEHIIALHLKKILTNLGHEVLDICSEGNDAIIAFDKHMPNLLFVDIRLKGDITGIEVVKKIKEQYDVPVIYVTSCDTESTYIDVKSTNPIAFLKKPFDEFQLKANIEIILKRHVESSIKYNDLKKVSELQELNILELTETNSHLITATWRERELKDELQKTKLLVEEQNNKIMDSINYAKRIQQSIIPNKEVLDKLLGDYFLFYKPKDVVSGDFPWIYERGNYIYIAVVDCTGHGVPGAMMSLIGALLLNDVVNNQTTDKTPAELLNELHFGVVKTLKQDKLGNKAADGMDVALCRINKTNNKVLFAGAHRPLYHLKNGELIEYKGCKFPIGGMHYNNENNFKDHEVMIEEDDSIYFFSDGLPDQFGGPERLKFGPKKIRQLILENQDKPLSDLKNIFEESFHNWKADTKQIDDVLMIGVKF
ncbi:MAG: hypothetical protein A3K10_13710 [Bacteroidetes bacterium RIFCSPLOWO2_12_FULL_31_6]|nr:MAG: hypothetical protein A3K10_13710 [Bacteroidetes bacterium RIFCSPLOWO2_12_FULL_31_6]